jgi:hypothetical protein
MQKMEGETKLSIWRRKDRQNRSKIKVTVERQVEIKGVRRIEQDKTQSF